MPARVTVSRASGTWSSVMRIATRCRVPGSLSVCKRRLGNKCAVEGIPPRVPTEPQSTWDYKPGLAAQRPLSDPP